MKTLIGVLGLLLLIFGALVVLIGVGGALANFVFPPESYSCKLAEQDYQKTKTLLAEYEAAKGTPTELMKKVELEQAISGAQTSQNYCNQAKDSHRFYGLIFSGVGVVGLVMTVIGAIAAFLGLRKKRSMA